MRDDAENNAAKHQLGETNVSLSKHCSDYNTTCDYLIWFLCDGNNSRDSDKIMKLFQWLEDSDFISSSSGEESENDNPSECPIVCTQTPLSAGPGQLSHVSVNSKLIATQSDHTRETGQSQSSSKSISSDYFLFVTTLFPPVWSWWWCWSECRRESRSWYKSCGWYIVMWSVTERDRRKWKYRIIFLSNSSQQFSDLSQS